MKRLVYWCEKCQQAVTPVKGEFTHPHLGVRTCLICFVCKTTVYPKDIEDDKIPA